MFGAKIRNMLLGRNAHLDIINCSNARLDIINCSNARFGTLHLVAVCLTSLLETSVLQLSCLRKTDLCQSSRDDGATSLCINCFSILAYRDLYSRLLWYC